MLRMRNMQSSICVPKLLIRSNLRFSVVFGRVGESAHNPTTWLLRRFTGRGSSSPFVSDTLDSLKAALVLNITSSWVDTPEPLSVPTDTVRGSTVASASGVPDVPGEPRVSELVARDHPAGVGQAVAQDDPRSLYGGKGSSS